MFVGLCGPVGGYSEFQSTCSEGWFVQHRSSWAYLVSECGWQLIRVLFWDVTYLLKSFERSLPLTRASVCLCGFKYLGLCGRVQPHPHALMYGLASTTAGESMAGSLRLGVLSQRVAISKGVVVECFDDAGHKFTAVASVAVARHHTPSVPTPHTAHHPAAHCLLLCDQLCLLHVPLRSAHHSATCLLLCTPSSPHHSHMHTNAHT
jgi:hypothetical protein